MALALGSLREHKVLSAAVGILVVTAIILGVVWVNRDMQTADPSDGVIKHSTDTPGESPIKKESYDWKGSERDPKYIALPSINASGYIQKMGVDQHKQVAVPTNIHLGGWFVNSVRPAQSGLSVIVGHVNGRKSDDGIFKNLDKLKEGDQFSVEFGNGEERQFVVKTVQSYDVASAANYLFSQSPDASSQLNLVTCGGTYDKAAKTYNKRVIVTSEPVAS